MEVNCERPSPKEFLVLESEEGKRVVARERIKKNSLFGPFPGKEVTSKEKRSANCWEVSRISGCVSKYFSRTNSFCFCLDFQARKVVSLH